MKLSHLHEHNFKTEINTQEDPYVEYTVDTSWADARHPYSEFVTDVYNQMGRDTSIGLQDSLQQIKDQQPDKYQLPAIIDEKLQLWNIYNYFKIPPRDHTKLIQLIINDFIEGGQ